jgi:hypothetical protein
MAAKLESFYAQATAEQGSVGRMKLAMLTKIPSEKAKLAPDSEENLRLFESAMKQLRIAAG